MSPEIVDEETQVLVPIESLVIGDSPRLAGINADHVRVLAEMDENLPPILVHRRRCA